MNDLFKYNEKIVTEEQFELIEESEDIIAVENNGNSGQYPSKCWYTAYTNDGEEINFYF